MEEKKCECELINARCANIKSRMDDTVYDYLTTCYHVWSEDIPTDCDWDESLLWDAYVHFTLDEFGTLEGYLGDDVDESDSRTEIRMVFVHQLMDSLEVFKEYPHSIF